MKKIMIAAIGLLLFTGCKYCENCKDDIKPVSPEEYSDEKGNSEDPVFKDRTFWWELK